jgi:hypothetical protein
VSAIPASAQSKYDTDTGSHIRIPKRAEAYDRKLSDEELGRELMNQFARCIIDRRPTVVAQAIASKPGEESSLLNRAAVDDCLDSGSMRFPPEVLRGAIFGELYRRQQRGVKRLAETFPIQPLDWSSAPAATDSERARSNYYLLWMTDCVHKTSGEAMRSIVMNSVGSVAQKSAYSSIIPALGPCVPQGQKLVLSRSMLEAAFGEYLWRSQVPAITLSARSAG